MDRNRVVDACLNSTAVQVLLQFVAITCTHHVKVKDVFAAGIEGRDDEFVRQTIRVDRGVRTT